MVALSGTSAVSGIFVVEVGGLSRRRFADGRQPGRAPDRSKERGRPTLEVHLFDFDERIYGRPSRCNFSRS